MQNQTQKSDHFISNDVDASSLSVRLTLSCPVIPRTQRSRVEGRCSCVDYRILLPPVVTQDASRDSRSLQVSLCHPQAIDLKRH